MIFTLADTIRKEEKRAKKGKKVTNYKKVKCKHATVLRQSVSIKYSSTESHKSISSHFSLSSLTAILVIKSHNVIHCINQVNTPYLKHTITHGLMLVTNTALLLTSRVQWRRTTI